MIVGNKQQMKAWPAIHKQRIQALRDAQIARINEARVKRTIVVQEAH